MLLYLLRATIVSMLLYGLYKFFMSKNTFYSLNRVVLACIIVATLLLPLHNFNLSWEWLLSTPQGVPTVQFIEVPSETSFVVDAERDLVWYEEVPWLTILLWVYLAGVAFGIVRYGVSLVRLLQILRKSEKINFDGHTVYVSEEPIVPFSWWSFVVISRKDLKDDPLPILLHERGHSQKLHSLDRVVVDLFAICFWFNPFAALIKRELQTIHEFQADEAVLLNGVNASKYQLLLIRKSAGDEIFSLANNFLKRDLTKRIRMMLKPRTDSRRKWLYSLFAPAGLLIALVLSIPAIQASPEASHVEDSEVKNGDASASTDRIITVLNKDSDLSMKTFKGVEPSDDSTMSEKEVRLTGVLTISNRPANGIELTDQFGNSAVTGPDGSFELKTRENFQLGLGVEGDKWNVSLNVVGNHYQINLEPIAEKQPNVEKTKAASTTAEKGKKITIHGTIRDDQGVVPGAIVEVRGTSNQVKTDQAGQYTLGLIRGETITIKHPNGTDVEFVPMEDMKNYDFTILKGKNGVVEVRTTAKKKAPEIIEVDTSKKDKPYILVDGKELPYENLKDVESMNIYSIEVFKGDEAVQKYGEKGKHGAIIIQLKK